MANWTNEKEAREQIKALVAKYYHDFKEKKDKFKPGDRISYASRAVSYTHLTLPTILRV